jgi:GTP1/Obg family GTP-binding protein
MMITGLDGTTMSTNQQFEELERQLLAAEDEVVAQMYKRVIECTPAIENLQFKSLEYIRRLVDDRKKLMAKIEWLEQSCCGHRREPLECESRWR